MRITWLGQAGFLFETKNLKIMIDPYFSDSCEKINKKCRRKLKVDENFLRIKPDYLILTHNHLDHTDPDTIKGLVTDEKSVRFILSRNAHDEIKKQFGAEHDYIIFEEGIVWTDEDIVFKGVKAYHSEATAFGILIEYENKKYYITGDTLYNQKILDTLSDDIYAIFLPINGVGNNMNITDARNFAMKSKARYVVPMHFGMFDDLDPKKLNLPNMIIPKAFKETEELNTEER